MLRVFWMQPKNKTHKNVTSASATMDSKRWQTVILTLPRCCCLFLHLFCFVVSSFLTQLSSRIVYCMILDNAPRVPDSIMRWKRQLSEIIQPNFGLIDKLLSRGMLTDRQLVDVRNEKTVNMQNIALLDLLTSDDRYDEFLTALLLTDQQHVINFIQQDGGQKDNDFMSVICD